MAAPLAFSLVTSAEETKNRALEKMNFATASSISDTLATSISREYAISAWDPVVAVRDVNAVASGCFLLHVDVVEGKGDCGILTLGAFQRELTRRISSVSPLDVGLRSTLTSYRLRDKSVEAGCPLSVAVRSSLLEYNRSLLVHDPSFHSTLFGGTNF
jgi:hypothetical protein